MFTEWVLVVAVCTPNFQCDEYVIETFDTANECVLIIPHVDLNGVQSIACEVQYFEIDQGE